jgi:hypothetical protein
MVRGGDLMGIKLKEIFTKEEQKYLEELWTNNGFGVNETWKWVFECKRNYIEVVDGLWFFYAMSKYTLGDAQDRTMKLKEMWGEDDE